MEFNRRLMKIYREDREKFRNRLRVIRREGFDKTDNPSIMNYFVSEEIDKRANTSMLWEAISTAYHVFRTFIPSPNPILDREGYSIERKLILQYQFLESSETTCST